MAVSVAWAAPSLAGPLPRPPEVASSHGVARLTLVAMHDPATNLPGLSFNGAFVPPTIRVNPGDHIKITLINALPREMNQGFQNMTNLHYHGMKTSPNQPADDVIDVMVMPGHRYEYDVPIPKDESPGLYFYHPHPHGESNRQVSGGMTGAIIVNGIEKYYPQVAHVPERLVLLRDAYPNGYPVPPVLAPPLRQHAGSDGYKPVCNGSGSENVTINGVDRPTIELKGGTTQYWRFANMSANTFVDIAIDDAKLLVIARDGEPIVYRDRHGSGVVYSHYLLAPANRVEFFVTGPTSAAPKLRSLCVDTGPLGHIDPERVLADIDNTHSGGSALTLGPASLVPIHKPQADIRTLPIAAKKTIVFTENPNGQYFINGQLYDPTKPPNYFAKSGTVEEWTVVNKTQELHAFHIHQIHFVVEEQSRGKAPLDYQDTVSVPYETRSHGMAVPGTVHLLMDFTDPIIKGTFVFHCHILEHEDGGMMQKITVR